MNIVNLKIYAADEAAISELLQSNQTDPEFPTQQETIQCQTCHKTCKIELTGWRTFDHNIRCPVCGSFLYSTQFSVAGVYVTKDWL
jgi:uncharacterized paraquat-inducible protein A